ncbi:hypothetical protein [Neobacillus sp. 204]|uniref:hypothetical protein n=1 Tax=Neobacillus sp. 204 TaxID=3383351 RepID=UPI00397A45B6
MFQDQCEKSRIKQKQYFAIVAVQNALDELIEYSWSIWGDDWTKENLIAYQTAMALNKFLAENPSTEELFENQVN